MSAMNNGVSEGAPWLPMIDNHCRTATILEGAEVVRTAAVSYATPIIHQVYIKGSPSPFRVTFPGVQTNQGTTIMNHNTTTVSSKDANKISSVGPSTILSSLFKLGNSDTHLGLSEKVDIRLEPQCSTEAIHPPCSSVAKLTSSSPSPKSSMQSSETPSSSSQIPRSHFTLSSLSSESKLCCSLSSQPLIYSNVSSSMNVPLPTASPPSESSSSSSLSPTLPSTRPDDELTSLSWLQDSNLLRGTALKPIKSAKAAAAAAMAAAASSSSSSVVDKKRQRPNRKERTDAAEVSSSLSRASDSSARTDPEDERKADSPASDYGDEPSDASSDPIDSHHNVSKQAVPYNPKVHTMAKPPFSFSCLIFMAIEESSTKALPVKDIYTWIIDHYPYYKNAPTGWKNSVRHNLSLNKCFAKVEKAPSLGKGSLWMVDQNHRPNLLQAMSKAPFTSVSPLDRSYTLSSKAVNNSDYQFNLVNKSQDMDDRTSIRDLIRTTEDHSSRIMTEVSPSDRKSPGSPKLRIPTRQYHRNTAHDANNLSKANNNNSTNNNNHNHISNNNIFTPNPELFPLLAKRLELKAFYESQLYDDSSDIDVQIEDVAAASAMMVLKHGPRMLTPLSETYMQLRKHQHSLADCFLPVNGRKRKDSMTDPHVDSSNKMFISSSPSMDHSYITQTGNGVLKSSSGSFPQNGQSWETDQSSTEKNSPSRFDDDDNERPWMRESRYNHRPLEEANALLNLASVATSLASRRDEVGTEVPYFAETHSAPIESQLESRTKSSTKNNNTVNKRSSSTKNVSKRHGVNTRVLNKFLNSKDKRRSLDIDLEQSPKVATVAKSRSLVGHSRFNNNISDVLNRNKVLKHKKLRLRRHKVC